MQYIDENTWIEEELVTCAGYQRFLDEMRAQGKYYQPDHWTSYEYPQGQAGAPVLGVRASDALDFCQWLTGNDPQEWRFRLPTGAEAERYPVRLPAPAVLGYWVTDLDEETQYSFAWIGTVPAEARILDLPRDYSRSIHRNFGFAFEFTRNLFNDFSSPLFRSSLLRSYLDLMNLYERCTGHAPAFEGIRLVKERAPALVIV